MMRSSALIALAVLLSTTVAGCATLRGGEANRLRDEADALLQAREYEDAYRKLAMIRSRHPDSREAREVFPAAALVFKRLWWQNRYTNPESAWLTTEPRFLFEWFESFAGDEFPQHEAERLLLGMPGGFYDEYRAFAETRPALAGWRLEVAKDNGILESIAAVRAD